MALFNSSWACSTLKPNRLVPSTFNNWSPGWTPPKQEMIAKKKKCGRFFLWEKGLEHFFKMRETRQSTTLELQITLRIGLVMLLPHRVRPQSHVLKHLWQRSHRSVLQVPGLALTSVGNKTSHLLHNNTPGKMKKENFIQCTIHYYTVTITFSIVKKWASFPSSISSSNYGNTKFKNMFCWIMITTRVILSISLYTNFG